MKKFNPEKELKKIENGNRNKILYGIIALLLIVAVGSTYALYQVRHTKSLVYTTVSDFKKRDIYLSVLVDGKTQGDFPKNNEGKIYSGIECDKEYSEAYFDNTEWELHFTSDGPNKCTVKFETGNLPNAPELYQGMIPIVFSDTGLMYVADTSKDWYNYQDHRWANVVLVDASNTTIKNKYFKADNTLRDDIAGKEVPMEEVLQMYVWIPRYKYQLFNVGEKASKAKQIINIAFEKEEVSTGEVTCTTAANGVETCQGAANDKWYTHPAFTFGNTNLTGFWVGKFEPSDAQDPTGGNPDIKEITILPNKTSMARKTVKTMFDAEQKLNDAGNKYNLNTVEVDTRMMRNMEWGAVAYLTQSVYGIYKDEKTCNIKGMGFDSCEVWINNTAQGAGTVQVIHDWGGTYTGCVGDSVNAGVIWNVDDGSVAKCKVENRWNEKGVNASTTGNMYGVYDMAGGIWEYTMALIMEQDESKPYYNSSGFDNENMPDSKYYDLYEFGDYYLTHERGHLGDATREILQTFKSIEGGWNKDFARFPYVATDNISPWFVRGGEYDATIWAGVFSFSWHSGGRVGNGTFRSVLSAA